jgi:type I restriction enzyme S subunit
MRPGLADNNVMAVVPHLNESDRYLYYFLRTVDLSDVSRSTTVPSVRKGDIDDLEIPLPPLAEQKVIADKLDTLLAQVENTKVRLERIPQILKRFRQSVLAAAVSGRLTEEWRGANKTENIVAQLDSFNSFRKQFLKVRGKKGWSLELDKFDLPENWSWIENHNLAEDSRSAICAGPFGTIFKSKDFREEGVPIIFLRHVKEEGFNQRKPNYMDAEVWEELHQEYSVFGGELLVTKLGDPPGECCIYPESLGVAMVTPDVLKMNVDSNVANKNYIKHFFNSPISKRMIADAAFGATRLRFCLKSRLSCIAQCRPASPWL